MKLYKTVAHEAIADQTIEKSKFIAHVKPVSSREEADSFITDIKKKYRDATHNVPAMVVGEKMQIQWASDDGEPQGTSGAPIVRLMVSEGITDTVIVVTRYFGGIKLGTGGLARAYTSTAKMGLKSAGICQVSEMTVLRCRFDYNFFSKIQNAAGKDFQINNINYTDKIEADIECEPECSDEIRDLLVNITDGRIIIKSEEKRNVKQLCSDETR